MAYVLLLLWGCNSELWTEFKYGSMNGYAAFKRRNVSVRITVAVFNILCAFVDLIFSFSVLVVKQVLAFLSFHVDRGASAESRRCSHPCWDVVNVPASVVIYFNFTQKCNSWGKNAMFCGRQLQVDTAPKLHVILSDLNNASLRFPYIWWRLCLLRLSGAGYLGNPGDFGSPYKMSSLILFIRTR